MPTSPSRLSPEVVAGRLKELSERYPQSSRLVELGRSHEDRPLLSLVIADDLKSQDPRPAVLLNGAHHGGEVLSIDIVLDAIDLLLEPSPSLFSRIQRLRRELVFWCVPQVNPDGVAAVLTDNGRSDRKNARDNNANGRIDSGDGVDLNRNYPFRWGALGEKGSSSDPKSEYYRGPGAASEPETQAMMALARRERPVASISYHTGTVAVLCPYTIDGCQDPQPNEARQIAEWMTAQLPHHPQDRDFVLKRNLYPVDGTDQDWLRNELGTLALLVESARHSPQTKEERQAIVAVIRNTWMLLFERFLDGPSVSGRVQNEAGEPIVAQVSIVEQTLHEGECWTSRPGDGSFHRFLPGPGRYTLKASVPELEPLLEVIEVEAGRVEVVLTIPGAKSEPSA